MSRELLKRVIVMLQDENNIGADDWIELAEEELAKPEIEPRDCEVITRSYKVEMMTPPDALGRVALDLSKKLEKELYEALTAANQFRAERDELRARIKGGSRCFAYKPDYGIPQVEMVGFKYKSNATIILDEGVTLP